MSRRGKCHDIALAESFFQLISEKGFAARFTQPGKMPGLMSSITSRCSTTQSVVTIHLAGGSLVEFEKRQFQRLGSVSRSESIHEDSNRSGNDVVNKHNK